MLISRIKNIRLIIVSVVLGFLFSAFNVVGNVLQEHTYLSFFAAKDFFALLVGGIILSVVIFGVTILLEMWSDILVKRARTQIDRKILIIIAFVVICISYIVSLLAAFPGVFSYDAPHQLWQFVTGNVHNNQPVVSSAILYVIMSVGKKIFGSWEGGVLVYVILQIVFSSFTFSYMLSLVYEHTRSIVMYVIGLVFFAFHPMNQLFVVNCAKDIIYAYFVVWIVMLFGQAVKNRGRYFKSLKNCILLTVFILLFLFYRNNSIYALIIYAVAALVYYKYARKQLLVIFVCTIGLYYFVTGPVYDHLNLQAGNSLNEMMAIPEQQLVNTYIKFGDDFTQEEKDMFAAVFPEKTREECAAVYSPTNSDMIRPRINSAAIEEMGLGKFVKIWAGIGIRHPRSYIEAGLNNTRGYWYVNHKYTMMVSDRYIEYTNSQYETAIHTDRKPVLKWLSDNYFRKIAEETTGENTKNNWLFSIASTFILFLYLIGIIIYKRRSGLWMNVLLLAMLYVTLFAGPLALMRYVYPVTLCLPYLFATALENNEKNK